MKTTNTNSTEAVRSPPLDLSVVISASARVELRTGDVGKATAPRLVHAITVSHPVQSWTVIRDHDFLVSVGNALSSSVMGLPRCPPAPLFSTHPSMNDDVEKIVKTRNASQDWLSRVLSQPAVRDTYVIHQLLLDEPNAVPPQFEGIGWISFSSSSSSSPSAAPSHQQRSNFGELEMEEMFGYEEGIHAGGGHGGEYNEEDETYDGDTEYYSAAERYHPVEEAVTNDDIMDIHNNADDVEMVEDVGSLAQSLGASHLGRSLQLQAQLAKIQKGQNQSEVSDINSKGLQIGDNILTMVAENTYGGIGGAVEHADSSNQLHLEGLGDSFNRKKPVSAPRLDSFKIIKVIGKGSFGKVFLVKEVKTGQMYALKALRKDNIIKRNQVEHTKTERSVLGYVRHPFIVGLNMAFQSKDKLYFVLDYCAGGELFFHLSKVGKFQESRARFYAAEIVLAIAYVHKLDIIYRDLKPENVLLDAKGHIRLTDFGLSKEGISSSSSGANSFCGTPEYLAPEILNRQGHGRAVDWWSLGALLYEMLTGLPPFYCRDREKLFEKIKRGELDYPRYLSSRAQLILRGLLRKDPLSRLGSGSKDAEEIQQHVFFSEIDWMKLANGDLSPPWDPNIHGSLDTSQFDEDFTNMPIFSPSSFQSPPGFGPNGSTQENVFEGFTFTDSGFYRPDGSRS